MNPSEPTPRIVRRPTAFLAGLLLLLAPALGSSSERAFEDSIAVALLEIPVTVTLDGQPLRELTREDFVVKTGRKRRALVDFQVVDLGEELPSLDSTAPIVPTAARRHVLIVLDRIAPYPDTFELARQTALATVEQFYPSDLVGVATLGGSGAQFVLGFTSDRRQLELALRSLERESALDRSGDPLQLTFENPVGMAGDTLETRGLPPGSYELVARFEPERLEASLPFIVAGGVARKGAETGP